jgi:hypothetical protein
MAERWDSNSLSPLTLRKLLISLPARIAAAATIALVGYSFGTHRSLTRFSFLSTTHFRDCEQVGAPALPFLDSREVAA